MVRLTTLGEAERRAGRAALEAALGLAARVPGLMLEARRVAASVVGVHGRRKAGPGESFWQFRALAAGEAASRIDWRRSARDGRLFVREREWESSHSLWLWIDRSASMGYRSSLAKASKIDRALIIGLALAEMLVEAGERVGLIGLSQPQASRRIVEKLAEALTADAEGLGADLPPAHPLSPFAEAVIVTDALTSPEEWAKRLKSIAGNGARGHVLLVVDPVEETFPFSGQAVLQDPEAGDELQIGDASDWREAYLARLSAHREALREATRDIGWTLTIHHTDRPASEALLRLSQLVASSRGRV
jgi:uncharacterized protein (DUF58 family)